MTDEEKIDEVLEEFDFDTVHKIMDFLKWKWANDNGTFKVPNHYQLIEGAKGLLYACKNDKNDIMTSSSGGFLAQKDKDENGDSFYTLSFIVCESSNY